MKKILYNCISRFLLCSMITTLLLMSACEEDTDNATAVITEVRNYAASPDDSTVQTVQVGQWVVLIGNNLGGVSNVLFGGVPASTNNTLFTDRSIVVQVPDIPFQAVPSGELHKITVLSEGGATTFAINVIGLPLITRIRNYDAAPNDTTLNSVAPGQHINLVGFNLKDATTIAFQGVSVDLSEVMYTDSSTIVKVPEDFTGGVASLANKITYTTAVGSITYSIPIFDPAILEYYKDPLWTLISGGIGNEKTWAIDFNAQGVSQKFAGPMWFSGEDLRWEFSCGAGGNCWNWAPEWQSWMPGPKDYGTMTFKIKGVPVVPGVTVNQKGLDASKNGIFSGGYFLDTEAKTITFTDVVPLNMGWDNVDWSKAYIITLTADGMQLGFKNKGKAELELYNYIPK
jgi:hypothetical protein